MKSIDMANYRQEYNKLMVETDSFFKEFGALDGKVCDDGAISKRNKELIGLAISVVTRCNEGILYHIEVCKSVGVTKDEMVEAMKIGMLAGGSVTFPNVRFAFEIMKELGIL